MIDPTTKPELVATIYYPLRKSKPCRGMGDADVMALARKVVDHIEMSGWEVTKRPPAPWHSTPGE